MVENLLVNVDEVSYVNTLKVGLKEVQIRFGEVK